MKKLVIIGAGMAAGRLVEHITEAGGWEITLFNAEPRGTYNRIMLSPVLSGEKADADIVTHDAAFYEEKGVICQHLFLLFQFSFHYCALLELLLLKNLIHLKLKDRMEHRTLVVF